MRSLCITCFRQDYNICKMQCNGNISCINMSITSFECQCSSLLHAKFWRYSSNPVTGLDRPWGFQEVEAPRFQDSWHMKVVRLLALRTDRLYPSRKYSWCSFLLEAESTPGVWPERLCQWKIPMVPSGIEPAIFRLVAQCLNQLRYRVPENFRDNV